ncbi:MAG: hypothetical protein K2J37_02720 [Ruminococcus sp.]|nr:hypothetical protein [Ruminococcus sp.]MDE6785080.1 hypothetical protein [Ruminococcus sp.]
MEFLAAVIIVYAVILLVSLAIGIVGIVAMWKLYEKAGEPGWSAIVPVYNFMQMCKIAFGNYKMAWIYLIITAGYFVLSMTAGIMNVMSSGDSTILTLMTSLIGFVFTIAISVIAAYVYYMFAKSYGKSTGFCILSIFFGAITIIIMGFDNNTAYVGPMGIPQNNYYNGPNNYYR